MQYFLFKQEVTLFYFIYFSIFSMTHIPYPGPIFLPLSNIALDCDSIKFYVDR